MKIGFIGLGNVRAKLAGSLLRNGADLTLRDLDRAAAQPFLDHGPKWADSPAPTPANSDSVITRLPPPAASTHAMDPALALPSTPRPPIKAVPAPTPTGYPPRRPVRWGGVSTLSTARRGGWGWADILALRAIF